jgi:hypothetical protein
MAIRAILASTSMPVVAENAKSIVVALVTVFSSPARADPNQECQLEKG